MISMQKKAESNEQIRLITKTAIGINLGLSILKTVVGIFVSSVALVADGIHSISDMVTDMAVLFGVHWGSKDADTEHPYGHGRIETFSAAIIALILLAVGLGMIYYSAISIAKASVSNFSPAVLVVAAISIVVKELLYRVTRRIAIKLHSSALYANAWHQRSDALSSVAVLIGFISLKFGFKYGDQIAAIAVGIMIVLVAVNILAECFRELTERAVDADTIKHIEKIIDSNEQVHQWHRLRSRTVGREVFLDLHILVAPALDITAAHEISENLEQTLHQQIHRPVNIIVHIEPDIPELRK